MTAMDAYVFPKLMPITAGASSETAPLAFSGTFPFATAIGWKRGEERYHTAISKSVPNFALASQKIFSHVKISTATLELANKGLEIFD